MEGQDLLRRMRKNSIQIPIGYEQKIQEVHESINHNIKEYLKELFKQKFIFTLKHIQPDQDGRFSSLKEKFYHQTHRLFPMKIFLQKNNKPLQNILKATFLENQIKIQNLIEQYQMKITHYLTFVMRKNNLLQPIKNSKLQFIANNYQIFQKNKYFSIVYETSSYQRHVFDIYYVIEGEIEKIKTYKQIKKKQQPKIKEITEKEKHKETSKFHVKQILINNKKQGIKINVQVTNRRDSKMSKQKEKKQYISIFPSQKIKHKKQISLRTLIQSGQFFGDQFFYQHIEKDSYFTEFKVVSDKAVFIKFDGDLVKRIIGEGSYLQHSQQFYQEKQQIQVNKATQMKRFNKRYKTLCRKRQQDKLKRQLSPQMNDIKQGILKRYSCSVPHKMDGFSVKQISKILNKRKKRMGFVKSDLVLPIVQVFQTFSQKTRAHQGTALSPLAIVKTNRNDHLLSKSQNILDQDQNSALYKVNSWQRRHSLVQVSMSPTMKRVTSMIKQRRRSCGGFQLLQMNRVIEKIKIKINKY